MHARTGKRFWGISEQRQEGTKEHPIGGAPDEAAARQACQKIAEYPHKDHLATLSRAASAVALSR